MTQNKIKKINQIIAIAIWFINTLMLLLKAQPAYGVFFILPFVMYPHAITHLGVNKAKSKNAQIVLMTALISYFAWFIFIYVDIFFLNLDAQGAVFLFFMGLYATPIMLIFWLISFFLEKKISNHQSTTKL